jgi:ABC-type branched-subunit amino acid transport system permease subunit
VTRVSDTVVPTTEPPAETSARRRLAVPKRLAKQPLVGSALLIVPLLLLVIVVQAFFDPAAELTATNFLINLIAVLGLSIFWGNSGILSLGHVGLMALGAYFGAALVLDPVFKDLEFTGLPGFLQNDSIGLLPGTLLTIVFVALAALLMGLLLLRMGGAAFVIASFGLLVIVYSLLVAAKELTHGAQGVYGLSGEVSIWTALAWAAALIVVARVFRDSIPGLQLRASREDELAARAAGVNVEVRRLQAWVLSAVPMAVAGILLGVFLSAFSPPAFYLGLTVTYIAMAIVGGLGTVAGAVAGTVLMTVLVEVLRRLEGGFDFGIGHFPAVLGLTQIGLSIAILLTLYLRPKGLVGDHEPDEHVVAKRARPGAPRRPAGGGVGSAAAGPRRRGTHVPEHPALRRAERPRQRPRRPLARADVPRQHRGRGLEPAHRVRAGRLRAADRPHAALRPAAATRDRARARAAPFVSAPRRAGGRDERGRGRRAPRDAVLGSRAGGDRDPDRRPRPACRHADLGSRRRPERGEADR